MSLEKKIAVVTGSSQGIGKAIALKLASMGAKVYIVARNKDLIDQAVNEILKTGGIAEGYVVNLASKLEIDNFCKTHLSECGIDIFVNNAGVTVVKDFLETTEEDMDLIFNVNLKGSIFFLQNVSKLMIEKNRGGNILIVTSVNAIKPLPSQAIYSCTKSALESIMQSMASTLAQYGIRVNSLAPGAILTAMNGQLSKEFIEEVGQTIPLKRFGTSEEMAELAAVLVSDKSSYVTGSSFLADGGLILRK